MLYTLAILLKKSIWTAKKLNCAWRPGKLAEHPNPHRFVSITGSHQLCGVQIQIILRCCMCSNDAVTHFFSANGLKDIDFCFEVLCKS